MICIKNYARQKIKENEDQIYSIKEILDKTKKEIKNTHKNKKFILKTV